MKRGTPRHPKMKALARRLKIPLPFAIGLMETLWHFAGDFTPQGDIGHHTDADISDAVGWRKKPTLLIEALVEERWLDTDQKYRLIVHDWPDHADDAVRKKLHRAKLDFLPVYGQRTPFVGTASGQNTDSGVPTRAEGLGRASGSLEVLKETSLQQIREPPKPKYSLDVYLDLFRMAGKALNAKDEMRTGTLWSAFEPAEQEQIIEWTAEQMRSVWSSEKYTPRPQNALETGGWTRKSTPRIISDPRPAPISKNDRAIEILKHNLASEGKTL